MEELSIYKLYIATISNKNNEDNPTLRLSFGSGFIDPEGLTEVVTVQHIESSNFMAANCTSKYALTQRKTLLAYDAIMYSVRFLFPNSILSFEIILVNQIPCFQRTTRIDFYLKF